MLSCLLQKHGVKVKPKENQWFDVGIVKVTNMVVTHYYVPHDLNMAVVRFCFYYVVVI